MIDQKKLKQYEYNHRRLPGEIYFTEAFHDKASYHKFVKEMPYIYVMSHRESGPQAIVKHDKKIVSTYQEAEQYIMKHNCVNGKDYHKYRVVGVCSHGLPFGQLELFTHSWDYDSTTDDNEILYGYKQLINYVKYNQDKCDVISLEMTRDDI